MSEVTRILNAMESGEARSAEELLPLVYEELRRLASSQMAREMPGHTLQATALVHEARSDDRTVLRVNEALEELEPNDPVCANLGPDEHSHRRLVLLQRSTVDPSSRQLLPAPLTVKPMVSKFWFTHFNSQPLPTHE